MWALIAPIALTATTESSFAQFWARHRCVAFGGEILSAATQHDLDPRLLAAIAAQETGGPSRNSGANIVGDNGHGFGPFQIDDRSHNDFTSKPEAMVPAFSADYAAAMMQELMSRYDSDVVKSLSAYNAGLGNRCGTRTSWPDQTSVCYAQSVLRHETLIENIVCP
jgi:hypothetical protein